MIRPAVFALVLVLVASIGPRSGGAAELVYFNSPSCGVCERWDAEIGGIYPLTDEAKRLPLRAQDIHDEKPEDIQFIKGVVFTPTFVVVDGGREVGRIVGYAGDIFFWEQMSELLRKLDPAGPKTALGAACSGPITAGEGMPC